MATKHLQPLLVVGMLLLAGCAGGVPGTETGDAGSTDELSTDSGSVNFYISDEEHAIDDFQHLNVTITKIGFERSSAEEGGWTEYEVDNRTVDLTRLKGENATLLESYDVPNGTYGKVFVHVGEVNATLQNGEQVNVKLPSEKLQIQKEFTVENGSETDFVFDIAVHKAGNSGKYILEPVISESGTDVPIVDVDEDELVLEFVGNVTRGENATLNVTKANEPVANATVEVNDEEVGLTDADGQITFTIPDTEEVEIEAEHEDDEGELEIEFGEDGMEDDDADEAADEDDETEDETEEADEDAEDTDLNATITGTLSQGENVTVVVTRNGTVVENATVRVNDEEVGETDASGELTFEVPDEQELEVEIEADGEELEVEIEADGEELELEIEVESDE